MQTIYLYGISTKHDTRTESLAGCFLVESDLIKLRRKLYCLHNVLLCHYASLLSNNTE